MIDLIVRFFYKNIYKIYNHIQPTDTASFHRGGRNL